MSIRETPILYTNLSTRAADLASTIFAIVTIILFLLAVSSIGQCDVSLNNTLLDKLTSDCQDCDPCTNAILSPEGECIFQQRTENASCINDLCYEPGAATQCQCGRCVGPAMGCQGWCATVDDCPALPLSPYVTNGIVFNSSDVYANNTPAGSLPVYLNVYCIWSSCVYKLTNIYENTPQSCGEYLDQTSGQVEQGCFNNIKYNDVNTSTFYVDCVFQFNCAVNVQPTRR